MWYISRQCQEVRLLPGQHFPPYAFYKCGECTPCMRGNKLPEGYDNGITRHSPHAMCKRKYLYTHSRHYMYIYIFIPLYNLYAHQHSCIYARRDGGSLLRLLSLLPLPFSLYKTKLCTYHYCLSEEPPFPDLAHCQGNKTKQKKNTIVREKEHSSDIARFGLPLYTGAK